MNYLSRFVDTISRSTFLVRLTYLKIFFGCLYVIGPFSHPHIVRQSDSLGIALRYWMRWTNENDLTFLSLLPAVITAGDGSGIMGTEFPILFWITAPAFALGDYWGRVFARVILLFLCWSLVYLNYNSWKGKLIFNIPMEKVVLLTSLFSISSLYIHRYMPDAIAFYFALLSIGLTWENKRKIVAGVTFTLALLLKPPVAITVGIMIFKPLKHSVRSLQWILPSIIFAGAYYFWGIQFINSFSEIEPFFKTSVSNPIESLIKALSSPLKFLDLFTKSYLNTYMLAPLLGFGFLKLLKGDSASFLVKAWTILTIQTVFIFFLNGRHTFNHDYYLIGVSFTCCLLLAHFFQTNSKKWMSCLVFLVLLGGMIERGLYEASPLVSPEKSHIFSLWKECKTIKSQTPEIPWDTNYHFKSSVIRRPDLGLCFGEIEGATKSNWGFYGYKEETPENCVDYKVLKKVRVVKCE